MYTILTYIYSFTLNRNVGYITIRFAIGTYLKLETRKCNILTRSINTLQCEARLYICSICCRQCPRCTYTYMNMQLCLFIIIFVFSLKYLSPSFNVTSNYNFYYIFSFVVLSSLSFSFFFRG